MKGNNMAYWNTGENLDLMPDYATALGIYNARKPYAKGRHKGERPLGKNRKYSRSRIEVDSDGNIRASQWGTDIITYIPDGDIVLAGGWDSRRTTHILQKLLGVDRICRANHKIYYKHDNNFYYVGGGLRIDPMGVPVRTNDESVYRTKPDVLKAYRKKYAFLSEYAKQVLTMSSDFKVKFQVEASDEPAFEGETLQAWYMAPLLYNDVRFDLEARYRARDSLFNYLNSLSDKGKEDRLQAMYELLAPVTYIMGTNHCRSLSFNAISWSCNYARFKRGFEELIKHHFVDDIFELTLTSKKVPVRDPNAKYKRTY